MWDFVHRTELPAPKTGGLYETGFVKAVPSRAFRDGTGI
jgi:hypothetical protein